MTSSRNETQNTITEETQETGLDVNIEEKQVKKSRKRKRDPSKWAKVVRKNKRNSGEAYISSRKKQVPAKRVKHLKDCTRCRKKCCKNISDEVRIGLFQSYYKLTKEEKRLFVLSNTEKFQPKRRRGNKTHENSKKQNTYLFYFQVNGKKISYVSNFSSVLWI